MKVKRWEIEYLDATDRVVGRHPEFSWSAERAALIAPLHIAEHEGAITWRVREVGLRV